MTKKNTASAHTDGDFLLTAQQYYEENQKIISGIVTAVLVLVAAYIGFFHWYVPNQEKEAQSQLFKAVSYFENEDYSSALNGDGNFPGFLDIIKKYKFTKAANLSYYYAGISYLNTGQYEEAIKNLKKFDSNDKILSTIALGAIGDAYFELNNPRQGIKYYKKACSNEPNEFTTPIYLLRTALALKTEGKTDEAATYLLRLKNEYPDTPEGKDAEKYLARIGK
jgi:tetratricopeptide (TPR) repeat protein